MSEFSPSPRAINPIPHPAWEEARNAVLGLAASGPGTIVLIGEPGTGKTWLLRELLGCFADRGCPAMMLMQGDWPVAMGVGSALLVDEALRMAPEKRAEMAAQDHGFVVLADTERFEAVVEALEPTPALVRMRALAGSEVSDFVSQWLEQAGLPGSTVDAEAVARIVAHSGGAVRLVVHLLGTATALAKMSGQPVVTGADIDRMAQFRIGGLVAPSQPEATPPQAPESTPSEAEPAQHPAVVARGRTPRRWSRYALGLAGSAIAACALGWAFLPAVQRHDQIGLAQTQPPWPPLQPASRPPLDLASAAPPPRTAISAEPETAAAETPMQTVGIASPALAANSAPIGPNLAAAPLAVVPPPVGSTGAPDPALASLPPPPALALSEPLAVGNGPEAPAISVASAPLVPALSQFGSNRRRGSPGLVLVAQRGDTLEELYDSIYRGRQPPPYAEVVAANPRPFKPGAIVIFPEPPGGWNIAQR